MQAAAEVVAQETILVEVIVAVAAVDSIVVETATIEDVSSRTQITRHLEKYLQFFVLPKFQRVILAAVVGAAVAAAAAIVLAAQDAMVRCAVAGIVEMIEVVHIK